MNNKAAIKYAINKASKIINESYEKYQAPISLQSNATPSNLVMEMVTKLDGLNGKDVLVVANYDAAALLAALKVMYAKQNLGNDYNFKSLTLLTDIVEIDPRFEDKFEVVLANLNEPAKIDMMGKKFDVVIGNPPYQDSSKNNTATSLWIPFLKMAVEHSDCVAFITPINWLALGLRKFSFLKDHSIRSAKIYDMDNTPFKGVGIRVGYYIIDTNTKQGNINFDLREGGTVSIDATERKNLPGKITREALSIWSKLVLAPTDKFDINRRDQLHTQKKELWNKEVTEEFPYKLYTSDAFVGCSVKRDTYNDLRVVIPEARTHKKSILIEEGNTAQCAFTLNVDTREEGESALSFINSKLVNYLINISKWGPANSQFTLENLPKIALNQIWTDEEIYEYFNLTQEEISEIESL